MQTNAHVGVARATRARNREIAAEIGERDIVKPRRAPIDVAIDWLTVGENDGRVARRALEVGEHHVGRRDAERIDANVVRTDGGIAVDERVGAGLARKRDGVCKD